MQTEPCSTQRPYSRPHTIDRNSVSPDVGIVMDHETARAIEPLRYSATVDSRPIDQVEERLMQFRKIADFGRPVVHLGIDINRVFTIPWRRELIIPDALQGGRHAARAAARHQQVSAVLKIERLQCEVFLAGLHSCKSFVGWMLGCWSGQLKLDTAKQSPVIIDVSRA